MDNLIKSLVAEAKRKGVGQGELAKRAGMHPVSMSRAASTGNCQLSSVQALAKQLGLRIVLVPDNSLAEGLAKGDLFS